MPIYLSNKRLNLNYMTLINYSEVSCIILIVYVILGITTLAVSAESSIDQGFSCSVKSFADRVIRYDPFYSGGPAPTCAVCIDPCDALGAPDRHLADANNPKAVTLGKGGLLELEFIDNFLTNSGDAFPDVFVFEVGDDTEATFIAIRPTAKTLVLLGMDPAAYHFLDVGKTGGGSSAVDIDSTFPGYGPGELVFDAVQLVDDPNQGGDGGLYAGADIDAVGALSSSNAVCTEMIVGDINRDCVVDYLDFALMAEYWLRSSLPTQD